MQVPTDDRISRLLEVLSGDFGHISRQRFEILSRAIPPVPAVTHLGVFCPAKCLSAPCGGEDPIEEGGVTPIAIGEFARGA